MHLLTLLDFVALLLPPFGPLLPIRLAGDLLGIPLDDILFIPLRRLSFWIMFWPLHKFSCECPFSAICVIALFLENLLLLAERLPPLL